MEAVTGETLVETPARPPHGQDPAAVALGQNGGLEGGKARAAKMTPGRRRREVGGGREVGEGPGVKDFTSGPSRSENRVACFDGFSLLTSKTSGSRLSTCRRGG